MAGPHAVSASPQPASYGRSDIYKGLSRHCNHPTAACDCNEMRQPGLDLGLFLCNAKGTPGETGASITEVQMDQFHTPVENTKLSPWFFAVNWGILTLQQKVADMEAMGMNPVYDLNQLEQLQDLEQFLKMSWDQWLTRMETGKTAQEVK